jgi:hypothetical protein
MKDKIAELTATRARLFSLLPDSATILPGSLLSRMVRCNKPGCQYCTQGEGKGHGPIRILSVSLGNRRARQVPIPSVMKKEVEQSLRSFARMQQLLKQIALLNVDLLKERKRRQ